MNKALMHSITLAILMTVPYVSQADDALTWENAVQTLKGTGCDVSTHGANGVTNVAVSCDRDTIINEIPMLKEYGVLNSEITQTQINTMPNLISSAYVIQAVVSLIHPLYASSMKPNITHWSVDLKLPDDYGNTQHKTMYTFDFTSALDKRVNWDKFPTQNLYKIAPNFHFTPFGESVLSGDN